MHEDSWNCGIELAYLLNKAIDLDPSDLGSADEFVDKLDKLNWQHAFAIYRNRRTAASFVEPYNTINNLGDELVFGMQNSAEEQNSRKEKLVEALDKAVNELIGREVYIQVA
jgi:hypothetical protein